MMDDGGVADPDPDLPGDPDPALKDAPDPDPDAAVEDSPSSFVTPRPSPPDDTRSSRPTVPSHADPTSSDSGRSGEVHTNSTGGLSAAAAAAWAAAASGSSSPSLSSEKVGVSEKTVQANANDNVKGKVSRSSATSSTGDASTGSTERYVSKEAAGASVDADTMAPTNKATKSASGSGGTVPKTPRAKPMTISPAPFKRSASSKALAAAAAQINAGTASTASSANPPTSAASSPSGKASSSGGSNNSSTPAPTSARVGMTTEVESAAAESGAGMWTPTQSPMPRKRDAAASMASSAMPGPPPLHTSSPLTNLASSSLLSSSAPNGGNNLTPGGLSSATASTSSNQQQKHQLPMPPLDATVKLDPDPPLLTALRERPLHKILPRPRRPSKCPLFCVFYSEFDIIVGPKLCYQSPDAFMDSEITVGIENIHDLLAKEFASVFPPEKEKEQPQQQHSKAEENWEGLVNAEREEAVGSPVVATAAAATRIADVNNGDLLRKKGVNEAAGDRIEGSATPSRLPDLTIPDIEGEKQEKGPTAAEAVDSSVPSGASGIPAGGEEEGTKTSSSAASLANAGRPPIPLRRTDRTLPPYSSSNSLQQQQNSQQERIENLARPGDGHHVVSSVDVSSVEASAFDSIFDSISEYIITGNDLADHMICLSTHNMHILSRPTIIKDTRYERNSLLFSVGFVLRRVEDPRPFRHLLSKLAHTLRSMEVESRFLTDDRTRPQLRRILQGILVSLNSKRSECNLLLDKANVLNLKLFRPPREPAPPVPDHAVPVLLRPEWQMDMYDWDLTINWILPHIDGFKHARLISQSSEVDLDMVLACLRVLMHHGVLALVDVFRYENTYECTPRAASMLAGEQAELLDEAYSFVSKIVLTRSEGSSCGSRAPTPAFLDNHHRNPLSPGIGENPNAPADRSVGRNVGFDPSTIIRPASGTTLVPPRQATFGGTSYPPLSASEALAHANIEASARYSRSPGTSPARHGVSQTSSRLSVSASEGVQEAFPLPSRKKEKRLKSALAQLYSSCCREKSFGDILIEKVTEPPEKVKRTRSRGSSIGALDSSEHGSDSRHRQAGEMHSPPSRSTFSDASVESESHLAQEASISSTPQEDHKSGSPGRRKRSDSEVLDVGAWIEAFEHFDHRRFVTFGVIHGLIRRVHSWPLAYDLDPLEHEGSDDEEDGSASDSLVHDHSAHSDSRINTKTQQYYPSEKYHHLSRKPYVSPTLQSVPFSAASPSPLMTALKSTTAPLSLGASAVAGEQQDGMNGQKLADDRKATIDNQLKRLANCVAESMDGTRCDDELCCMYPQKSLKDLLELISTVHKGARIIKAASVART